MLEIVDGALDINEIQQRWYMESAKQNCGALVSFVGIIREENGIDGLSFDIYQPMLKIWFEEWQIRAKSKNAKIFMAHSLGNVYISESSFIAAILSPKRKVALEFINIFVENFKVSAPIWKYDIIDGKRFYAEDRSQMIEGGGILA